MQYIKNVVIGLLMFLAVPAGAQKVSLIRMEVPAALESAAFRVETIGKDGVLIFYESNEMTDDNLRKWYFGLFNTKLNRIWMKFVPLQDNIYFVKSVRSNGKVHFLFRSNKTGHTNGDFYEIVNYDISKQAFSNISGTIPEDADIRGFEALGDKGCLGINLKKYGTDVLFINLNNGDIEAITLEPDKDSYIESIGVDQVNKYFYVALKYEKDNRYIDDKLYRFSSAGQKEKEYAVANQQGLKLLRNFIFMPAQGNKLVIMGTYDIIAGKMMTLKDLDEGKEARGVGMFMLQYENDTQKMLKYYDFLSFDNISSSFKGREMAYVRKKSGKENEGKQEKAVSAFYHFFSPQVLQKDGQYIFSVEIYKPVYKVVTQMEYDFYGRPMPQTYNVFDGYTFYDFILAAVSGEGDLLWNNDFDLRDMRTYFLNTHVALFEDGPFLGMACVSDGKLYSKTIDGSMDISSNEVLVETQFPKDRVAADENNSVVHWYENYFLVYGYQRLKNRTMTEQPVRTVFYANKVAYN